MTTFLPSPDFQRSADILDPVRRWQQTLEGRFLVKVLEQGPRCYYDPLSKKFVYSPLTRRLTKAIEKWSIRQTPYYTHPATKMWIGYVAALKVYTNTMLLTVLRNKTHNVVVFGPYDIQERHAGPIEYPPWLGDEQVHTSHKSRLLTKDYDFYSQYGWRVPKDLDYVWPNPGDYVVGGLFS